MVNELTPTNNNLKSLRRRANKSLGQHFLYDINLAARIVRLAGPINNMNIIEVGPGPGTLTRVLLEAGAMRVIAIEFDQRFIPDLDKLEKKYPNRLIIINQDALSQDLTKLCCAPRMIVANLPYNIATPLLISWLKSSSEFTKLILMFQKEVADRLQAKPKTKSYGRLSVMSQWLCKVTSEFDVSKDLFHPPPKVTSSVVSLTPRPQPLMNVSWEALETVTSVTFGQRRKMLRSTLKQINLNPKDSGIVPTKRPEELSIIEFCYLAKDLESKITNNEDSAA